MQKSKVLQWLIGLFVIAVSGCQSADLVPVAPVPNPVLPAVVYVAVATPVNQTLHALVRLLEEVPPSPGPAAA